MKLSKKLTIEHRDRYAGLKKCRLNSLDICGLLPISRKTAERYIRDPEQIPATALELIVIKAFGLCIPNEYSGFSFIDGLLVSPEQNRSFSSGDLLAYRWQIQRADILERKNGELATTIKQLNASLEDWRIRAGEMPASNEPQYFD